MSGSRVLVLAPHTDDAELGAGGTIARLVEDGSEVHVIAFSIATDSLPAGAAPDTLRREFHAAMDSLKIPGERARALDLPVRNFPARRQEILDELILLRNRIRPDLVLMPCSTDVHQDHATVHAEGRRAFKSTTLWGYELPWNTTTFHASGSVRLERRHVDAKWAALTQYRSQMELKRPYFDRELIDSLARVRGVAAGSTYAEAFEIVRQVW